MPTNIINQLNSTIMKKFIIPCILLTLSASCTNQVADDLDEQTEAQATRQYINLADGIKYGNYLVQLSTYCDDLYIPEYLWERINANPNDIEAIIKAMQILESQVVFGDTLGECDEYLTNWVDFCTINNIPQNYDYNY